MGKLIDKIKNFFTGRVIVKTKRAAKKEEAEPTKEVSNQESQEEQKQQPSA